MENKTCINCGKTIPEGAIICIACGTKNGEAKAKEEISKEKQAINEKGKMQKALTCAGIAGLSLIIMPFVNSYIGLIFYFISFIYAVINLKLIYEKEENENVIRFIKNGFKSITTAQKYTGIYLIVAFALPIMFIIFYNCLIAETVKMFDSFY